MAQHDQPLLPASALDLERGDARPLPRTQAEAPSLLSRLWREPLLHFFLLGAGVFALHHHLCSVESAPAPLGSDSARQRELVARFEQQRDRKPTPDEVALLMHDWEEGELLFREGLSLGLAESDPIVRDALIVQTRKLLEASWSSSPPSDAQLKAFREQHRKDYLEPPTVRLTEYWIHSDTDPVPEAKRLLEQLNRGEPVSRLPVEYPPRSETQLSVAFGPELAHRISELAAGPFHFLTSDRGVHLIRVDERIAGREPAFSLLRERLSDDFQAEARRRYMEEQLARLRKRFAEQTRGVAP